MTPTQAAQSCCSHVRGKFRMRQADIRKKDVKGFYWAFAMEFLYWALRSGNAKYIAVPEYAADERLERKLVHA